MTHIAVLHITMIHVRMIHSVVYSNFLYIKIAVREVKEERMFSDGRGTCYSKLQSLLISPNGASFKIYSGHIEELHPNTTTFILPAPLCF